MSFKSLLTVLVMGSSLFMASLSFALEVGDTASCLKLDSIQVDDTLGIKCYSDKDTAVQEYTIVEFSSINCSACLANFSTFNDLGIAVQDYAVTRTIMLDRVRKDVIAFVKKNRSDFSHDVALDDKRAASKEFEIMYTPTLFILDSSRKIVYKHIGTLSQTEIDEIIDLVSH